MDVDEAVMPGTRESGGENSHEPGKADQGTSCAPHHIFEFSIESDPARMVGRIDDTVRQTCRLRPIETGRAASAGNDDADVSGELSAGPGIDQRLQI